LEVERSTRDCQGMLVYKAGLPKKSYSRKNSRLKTFFGGFCGWDAGVLKQWTHQPAGSNIG